jgi:hypothetical protein
MVVFQNVLLIVVTDNSIVNRISVSERVMMTLKASVVRDLIVATDPGAAATRHEDEENESYE